ncbi:uncharacterized protein LOC112688772 isoform X2 [Sipha flava]|uniref:Uncharacterized protein LOC112688772 isoform X2 n=1 Tax=Sipha flava TaxID=143950 RepID=A0A8B8G3T5_9HEMI|nr:uncharacterized protein LOC112688772 isoform X2 [Sipha flava]
MMTRMLRAQLIDGDVNVLRRTSGLYWAILLVTVFHCDNRTRPGLFRSAVGLCYNRRPPALFLPVASSSSRLFISHMLCPVTDNVVGKRPPSIPRTSRKSVALLPIHRVERPTNLTFIRFLSATRTRIFLCFNVHQGSLGARTWIYLCFNLPHSADIFI